MSATKLTDIQGCFRASAAVMRLDGFMVNILLMRSFASGVTVSHSGEGNCQSKGTRVRDCRERQKEQKPLCNWGGSPATLCSCPWDRDRYTTGETVATGKSCQLENWRAGAEGERWKAQDKTYLSCKVELKHTSVCIWAWPLGQPSLTRAKKLAPVCLNLSWLLFWSSRLQGRDSKREGRP